MDRSPSAAQFNVGDLVAFYKEAKARFDAEPDFKEIARAEVRAAFADCWTSDR